MDRKELEPRLVTLIAGLRHHQVEEAVRLLLDYIDSGGSAVTLKTEVCNGAWVGEGPAWTSATG